MTDRIRRALLSVSDKTGLIQLAQALVQHGAQILSTGGSAKTLRDAGLPVTEVADHTGFPEILDGRVKTLLPQIHGGLLARRDDPTHQAQAAEHNIAPIDLIAVNLYPFEAAVASGAPPETCVENIDIGGPAMIRSAAKNHASVAVLTDPAQYPAAIDALLQGGTTLAQRTGWAAAAYARTAAYDAAIATWFARAEPFPQTLQLTATRRQPLRYGENPHQHAALYATQPSRPGAATAHQVQGKELSYNNLNDTDAAFGVRGRVRPAHHRHRQARQPLRRRLRARPRHRLGRRPPLRPRQRVWRHHRHEPPPRRRRRRQARHPL